MATVADGTIGSLIALIDWDARRHNEAPFTARWNEADDCFLCLWKKSLQRDYPRDLTEFEGRLADEPACPDLTVPTALAGEFFGVPIIRGIEKTLDLIDSLAGVIETNLNESTRVL
jgi:hypothetical protein